MSVFSAAQSPIPCTVENLLPLLQPISDKWKKLGGALSLDEDRLDEIFTIANTNEDCLRDVLEGYMLNRDFQHTWEEIVAVLKEIEEVPLAVKIQNLHACPRES